jgi:hypothetical protein
MRAESGVAAGVVTRLGDDAASIGYVGHIRHDANGQRWLQACSHRLPSPGKWGLAPHRVSRIHKRRRSDTSRIPRIRTTAQARQ